MKNIFKLIILLLLFSSCASSSKLADKGWSLLYKGKVKKSEKKFLKAIEKDRRNTSAYKGLCLIEKSRGNFFSAESYIQKAYTYNPNSSNTFYYAELACKNGNPNKAMELLYEIPLKGDFDIYKKLASDSEYFNSLKENNKFKRYLSGYRRLLIKPYYAYSSESDGLFGMGGENDLFVVIENQNKIILSTPVVENSNSAYWNNHYVVFDYPLNSSVGISLMEEDTIEHDTFISAKGRIVPNDYHFKSGKSALKVQVADTELPPQTTYTKIPDKIKMSDLAIGLGLATLGYAIYSDLDKTPHYSPALSASSSFNSCYNPTKNSTDLYVLSIGTDSDILADKDAIAITTKFRNLCGTKNLFGNIYTKTLSGTNATKQNILSSLNEMQKYTNEDDIFLLFFSGHGTKSKFDNTFYFATVKSDQQLISISDIIETLNSDNCKTIMWFDTCKSGRVGLDFRDNVDDYIRNKHCPNVSILMSSSDGEPSYPDYSSDLGFFTKAIIDGLNGAADKNQNKIVSLQELEDYVMKVVPIRTKNASYHSNVRTQHPQQLKDGKEDFKTRLSAY